jgi:predicted Zn-dependent peptidase
LSAQPGLERVSILPDLEILPNGVRLRAEESRANTTVVRVVVDAGSVDEVESTDGASHLTEHMVTASTQARSIIDEWGGTLDAVTMKEQTAFTAHIPSSCALAAAEELARVITKPAWNEPAFEVERRRARTEVRSRRGDTLHVGLEHLEAVLFRGTPLARPASGTERGIEALNIAAASRHHRDLYTGARISVSSSGALSTRHLARFFEPVSEGPAAHRPHTLSPLQASSEQSFQGGPAVSHVLVGYPLNELGDYNAVALLSHALGGSRNAVLHKLLRQEGQGYASASFFVRYENTGFLALAASVDTGSERRAADALPRVLDEAAPSIEQLRRSVFGVAGRAALAASTPVGRVNRLSERGHPESVEYWEQAVDQVERML